MRIYREWREFVYAPTQPDAIKSADDRLNLALTESNKKVKVVDRETILYEDEDEFEAMMVEDHGGLTIWTVKRVWVIRYQYPMERLMFLPRHPPTL